MGQASLRENNIAAQFGATAPRRYLLGRARARFFSLINITSHAGLAKQSALIAFSIRLVSAVIAYGSQIILARAIGVFDYGVYVAAWSLVLILGHVSGLGFALSLTRLVPEAQTQGDLTKLRGLLLASRLIGVLTATVAATLTILALILTSYHVSDPRLLPVMVILICLPLFTLTEIQDGMARCFHAPILALAPPYILRPLLILLVLGAALTLGMAANAVTAAMAAVIATWATALVQAIALGQRIKREIAPGPSSYTLSPWFSASLPLFLSEGARIALQNSDVLVLSLVSSSAEVGIYFAVTKTMVLGAFVAFAVNAAVAHRYAEYHVAGERQRLMVFVRQSTHWMFWPTLVAILLMLALGRPFLALFGSEFLAAYPLMFVLALGLIVRAAIGPAERLLSALGDQRSCAEIYGATLVVGLILQIILAIMLGVIGLAIAASLALMIETVLLVVALHCRHGIKIGLWRGVAPAQP